jgi:plastocyanin
MGGRSLVRVALIATCSSLVVALVPAATAGAKVKAQKETYLPRVDYPGIQHLRYRMGPIPIRGGADDIRFRTIPANLRPSVPGWVTRFKPTLTLADGSVPSVDVIHLHHAVWLVDGAPTYAAGEEKTIVQLPKGFGWRYTPDQSWSLNDMIHNLETKPYEVYVVWDIDFIPDTASSAASIKPVGAKWMDVAGVSAYPVFNAYRGDGDKKGRYTFPKDARGAERAKIGPDQTWTVPRDMTIIQTAGHLHPGGLYTDLFVSRNGVRKRLFRSNARYYGPAGPVTWDVSMQATPPDWRVLLKKGDVVTVSATYNVSKASWYEGMGIMVLGTYDGTDVGGVDPFVTTPPQQGILTHGELVENKDTAGGPIGLPDPSAMTTTPFTGGTLRVSDYFYAKGDLNKGTKVPVIAPGQTLTFDNSDWGDTQVLHTITACAAPCNRRGGISFPLADGPVEFDSGNLGYGVPNFAAQRTTWTTPATLKAGTYTYFCRIHPFMRGAFKVAGSSKKKKA